MNFIYYIQSHTDKDPKVLYRFDTKTTGEDIWNQQDKIWADCTNVILEAQWVTGELSPYPEEKARDIFPEAFIDA
jgi:hypothetical protein